MIHLAVGTGDYLCVTWLMNSQLSLLYSLAFYSLLKLELGLALANL